MDILKRWVIAALIAVVGATSMPALASPDKDNEIDLYGFLSWRVEKVWDELSTDGSGNTVKTDADREIAVPSFNIMSQYQINDKFKRSSTSMVKTLRTSPCATSGASTCTISI